MAPPRPIDLGPDYVPAPPLPCDPTRGRPRSPYQASGASEGPAYRFAPQSGASMASVLIRGESATGGPVALVETDQVAADPRVVARRAARGMAAACLRAFGRPEHAGATPETLRGYDREEVKAALQSGFSVAGGMVPLSALALLYAVEHLDDVMGVAP